MISKMEKTLLDWCRQSVSSIEINASVQHPLPDRIHIQNFTSSFSDGMAFLAILKRFHPHLVDETLVSRTNHEPKKVLDYVFQQFEKLGIPRLLDSEDFEHVADSNKGIDKKSVMTYIMCIFRKLHIPGVSSISNEKCESNSALEKYNLNRKSETLINPGM